MISIIPVVGVPEVDASSDLARLLFDSADDLQPDDVVVVTQKVVSKAEGRVGSASERAALIEEESDAVLRRSGTLVIAETRHGFVCASAGVDASNVAEGKVALLPLDPDASARRLRAKLEHLAGVRLGIVISDTFGRAWRIGQTDVAIGVAGFSAFTNYIGTSDTQGRILGATNICTADELAGAAELVMGKAEGVCAAVVRGAPVQWGRGTATSIVRPPAEDLFR